MKKEIAVRHHSNIIFRAVGPFEEGETRKWIDRQFDSGAWEVIGIEPAETINFWEEEFRKGGWQIMDYYGFRDWRQEWLMTSREFLVRAGRCVVRPATP